MPIPLLSTLVRQGEANYPLLDDGDVKGGWHVCSTSIERDAIKSAIRKTGMMAYVVSDDALYRLESDLSTWTSIPFGGGSGPPVNTGTYVADPSCNLLDIVYLQSSDTVAPADADDAGKQPVIGFVKQFVVPGTASVQYGGELSGFSGLIAGATYYMSVTPGQISDTPPTNPGDIIQRVGFAKNSTTLVVMVDRDFIIL